MRRAAQKKSATHGWLRRRAEFVALRRGQRVSTSDLIILSAPNPAADGQAPPRFGVTVTRQTANAVGRNRIRRRLRHAIALAAGRARPGHDHVLIARPGVLSVPFAQLVEEIAAGLDRAARSGNRPEPHSGGGARRSGKPAAGRN